MDILWARTPRLEEVDHWFYDLRDAGTEPPERLIQESRKMVLAWKTALGQRYFAHDQNAGGCVIPLETAHRTFKAIASGMSIAVWVSRACAKYQSMHDRMGIPMPVAKNGDPLATRPCP